MTPVGRAHRILSSVCAVAGVVSIVAAALLGYATHALFNDQAFASRVAASLDDPRVAGYVAERIADAVIKAKPDLVGVRPVLVGLARVTVSSPPFRAAIRRSARVMHHAIFSGVGKEIVLNVQDIDVLLESLSETRADLAKRIPPRVTAVLGYLGSLPGGERAAQLARWANRLRAGTIVLLLLGFGLCAASVSLSPHRRQAIVRFGITFAVLGLVLALAARYGGNLLALFVRRENSPALAGLGGTFLSGLMLWAALLGFSGLVVAAASASLLERIPLRHWGDVSKRWLTGPEPLMRVRFARGSLGAAAGIALLLWPLQSLTVASWLIGLVMAFAGLREAFVAALNVLPVETAMERSDRERPETRRRAMAWVAALALVLLAGGVWFIVRWTREPMVRDVIACNGSSALCDRRLDEVVFPTTHNSMGGADVPGWMFPNQTAGIERQLADGIRGFLIDVHYGVPVGDKVKTELQDEKAAMAKYDAALGPEGMSAVLRIRDRLAGQHQGDRDVYLCHGFCELGASRFVPVLKQIREFLVTHAEEVLIIVIQDESVTPQDVERCFQESGLIDFVYRGAARPPWPTLREMIETDQRVLVLAENAWAGVDWYHGAFEVLQETPYGFHQPSEFSNRPNRGGTAGSLVLLNHWIESTPMPKPSNAAIVNARDALRARILAFRRERGRLPNLVAVDFYGVGDLLSVVRDLNADPVLATRSSPPRTARNTGR